MSDPANALDLLVRQLTQRAELSADDRAAVLALPHVVRNLEASAYLVREGEHPKPCVVLLDGFACRHKLTGAGARQIVSIHVPGEALDFQHIFLDEADHNVQMLTRGTVALVAGRAIRELIAARPTVAHAVMVNVLAESSIYREWVTNVGRRDALARVAHLLCEFAVRLDAQGLTGSNGYTLPMTQEQIGDATGLTAVHVNRMLKMLETDGLVARRGRLVEFPDWQRLRDIADFGERYLHLPHREPVFA